jgi:DNA-directed RNA polymerase specialized sigma24 family protein
MNDIKQELLDQFDWNSKIVHLAAYAISLMSWSGQPLPKGLEPEDLVMQAIEKVYAEERNWNPDQDPDLFKYLKSVVKSLYSNATSSKDSELIRIDDLEPGFEKCEVNNLEEELYCRQLDAKIVSDMLSEPDLLLVYKALKDGFSPSEIEKEYGLPIADVRNAQKRLHRRVLSIIKILNEE